MRPGAERVPALLRIASMRPNGSGAASSRAGRARERPGLAMPMRGGGALSARALEWGRRVRANEKGAPARADAPE